MMTAQDGHNSNRRLWSFHIHIHVRLRWPITIASVDHRKSTRKK